MNIKVNNLVLNYAYPSRSMTREEWKDTGSIVRALAARGDRLARFYVDEDKPDIGYRWLDTARGLRFKTVSFSADVGI